MKLKPVKQRCTGCKNPMSPTPWNTCVRCTRRHLKKGDKK